MTPLILIVLVASVGRCVVHCSKLPVVINTWPFLDANVAASEALKSGRNYLDAIEDGCMATEQNISVDSVGYGGSPNEEGETTLDAMIMDGETHDVGSVGCLKNIKNAISVARRVMVYTEETLLVGEDATNFAVSMGFRKSPLETDHSIDQFEKWEENKCQPNYRTSGLLTPDPKTSCGPYRPGGPFGSRMFSSINVGEEIRPPMDSHNHDTIGMIVVDADGKIGCGTSTNGATSKIPGRVGDSPITGSGCYVEKGVGGAAATGDGDIMMRFLPAYQAVQYMAAGMSPKDAVDAALKKITVFYPKYYGAMIAVTTAGEYGAGYTTFVGFPYTVYNPELGKSTVIYA